jgi:hypothetical protein
VSTATSSISDDCYFEPREQILRPWKNFQMNEPKSNLTLDQDSAEFPNMTPNLKRKRGKETLTGQEKVIFFVVLRPCPIPSAKKH